jgi:hypothetical protein
MCACKARLLLSPTPYRSKLTLLNWELDLRHELRLVATALIFEVELTSGTTDVIAVGFNPFEETFTRQLKS